MATREEYAARIRRYRDKADECRRLAELAQPHGGAVYLDVADKYEQLAVGLETLCRSLYPLHQDAATP